MPCFTGSPIELHLLPSKFGSGDGGGGDSDSDDGGLTDADDFELDRAEREAVLVARRIHEMMGRRQAARAMQVLDRDGQAHRPIRYRDIVILLRSMRYKADQYADVLRQLGVPVHAESGTGYFESIEVRDMLALLALLDNQRQDIPLAAVLRSPLGALARAGRRPRPHPPRLPVARAAGPVPPGGRPRTRPSRTTNSRRASATSLRKLHGWRAARPPPAAGRDGLVDLRADRLPRLLSGLAGGEQRVANLMYLHERAAQFGTFQRQGLGRFMEFLEQLREESDLGQPSVASEADDVVRIMSVHRSKGLEFPVVFLPDLGKAINLSDCQGPSCSTASRASACRSWTTRSRPATRRWPPRSCRSGSGGRRWPRSCASSTSR